MRRTLLGLIVAAALIPATTYAAHNDAFAAAEALPAAPATVNHSTVGATTEAGEPLPCGAMGRTIWYTYTASSNDGLVFDTVGSSYDTVLAAYTGTSLNDLTQVACNDDTFGLLSQISFVASAGTTYYIQVGGYNGSSGSLSLNSSLFTLAGAPVNVTATPGPGLGGIRVTWGAATPGTYAIAGYNIYRNGQLISFTAGGSHNDIGLLFGQNYTYTIETVDVTNAAGGSASACNKPAPWVASLGCIP